MARKGALGEDRELITLGLERRIESALGFTRAAGAGMLMRFDPARNGKRATVLGTTDFTAMPLATTDDGRLIGLAGDQDARDATALLELDPDNGKVVATTPLPDLALGHHGFYLALAWHPTGIYTFASDDEAGEVVYRYDAGASDGASKVTRVHGASRRPFTSGIIAATTWPR